MPFCIIAAKSFTQATEASGLCRGTAPALAVMDCMAATKQMQDVLLPGLSWLQPLALAGCNAAAALAIAEALSAVAASNASAEVSSSTAPRCSSSSDGVQQAVANCVSSTEPCTPRAVLCSLRTHAVH